MSWSTWELVHLPWNNIFIVMEGHTVPVDIAGCSPSQRKLKTGRESNLNACTQYEKEKKSPVNKNEGLNLLVWLRRKVRWLVTPGIILPKDGSLTVLRCDELAKRCGSDTIKGFGELGNPAGTEHSFCPLPAQHLLTVSVHSAYCRENVPLQDTQINVILKVPY